MEKLKDVETNRRIADSLHNLGISYENINLENAIVYYKQAYELRLRIYDNIYHSSILQSLESIGNCYERMGDFEKSLWYKKKAYSIKRFHFDMNHFTNSKVLDNTNKKIPHESIIHSLPLKSFVNYSKNIQTSLNSNNQESLMNISDILHENGIQCEKNGECERALEFYQRSLEIRETNLINSNIYKSKLADSYYAIGGVLTKLGKYSKAIENFEKSLKIRSDMSEFPNPQKAYCLNSIGNAYEKISEFNKAYEYKMKSLEMRKEIYTNNHSEIADSLNSIGVCCESMGKLQEALEFKKEAYKMRLDIYQTDLHKDVANSLSGLGSTYEKMGDLKNSYKYLKQAYITRQDLTDSGSSSGQQELSNSLHNLGVVCERLNKLEESKDYFLKALEIRKKINSNNENNPELANTLNSLSVVFFKLCKVHVSNDYGKKAIEYCKMSLQIRRKIHNFDDNYHDIADSLYNLGVIHENLDQIDASNRYYRESLEIRKKIFGNNNHDLIEDLLKKLKLKDKSESNNINEHKNVEDWSISEISKWMIDNKINFNIIRALDSSQNLNGKLLEQFFKLSINTPELFNQTIRSDTQYKIEQEDIDHFRNCLINLFGKNNKNVKLNFIV